MSPAESPFLFTTFLYPTADESDPACGEHRADWVRDKRDKTTGLLIIRGSGFHDSSQSKLSLLITLILVLRYGGLSEKPAVRAHYK